MKEAIKGITPEQSSGLTGTRFARSVTPQQSCEVFFFSIARKDMKVKALSFLSLRSRIKKLLPQKALNLYFSTKRTLQKKMRHTPPDEVVHFNLASVYQGQFAVTYRGISTLRVPFDYVMYQMIVSEIQPDLVIEIGTNCGGTALYLADLMNALGHGTVHSIDIDARSGELVKNHPRIKLFTRGWEEYDLTESSGFSNILVIDDASHMYEDVSGALKKFAPIVSPGSYFIVEDGIIDEVGLSEQYRGGPLRAIREFLPDNTDFVVDRTYCDMFGKNATANVNGYLKRIARTS